MTVQEELRVLIERNHARLLEQLDALTRLLAARDRAAPLDPAPLAAAQGLTHQLRGSAGTIGFASVSAAAADLDEGLSRLLSDGRPADADELERCLDLLAALRRIASQTTPETSALYHADLPCMAR